MIQVCPICSIDYRRRGVSEDAIERDCGMDIVSTVCDMKKKGGQRWTINYKCRMCHKPLQMKNVEALQ